MSSYLLRLLPLLLAAPAGAQTPEPLVADIAWVAAGEFCEPETVLPLPDDTLLVSNVCGFEQQDNGFLSLLDEDGAALDWRVLEGLDAPLGMALANGQLYVVDNNRVKVFRWPGYEPLRTILLDTVVANDLAVGADDTVGGNRLWHVDLRDNIVTTIGPHWIGGIDGVEQEADGTLQVTPVGGPLIRLTDEVEVLAGEGVSSANHGWAENLRLALIPTGFDNTVIAIRIR